MPSPYTPPDVIVYQKRVSAQTNAQPPPLPVCIMAPCVAIVTNQKAGDYVAGAAFSAALPSLPAGATVKSNSLNVLLKASSAAGADLGLFSLAVPTDAQLGSDGVTVNVNSSIALAYSLISARNNQAGVSSFDDFGSGIPDGIVFSDDALDFLSQGASINDTDVVVTSPASIAGTYRIYELVGNGTKVNKVKVQKLADVSTGALALQKTFNITGGGFSSVNGTAIINGTATDVANADVGLLNPGGTVAVTAAANYPATGGFNVPAATSADQVVITMPLAQPAGVYTAFAALVTAARIGNFLRIGTDATAAVNADYKIVARNTTTPSITVQRIGQSGTGSIAATGGGTATMTVLRVMRGSADENNAAGDYVTMTIAGVTSQFEVASASPKQLVLNTVITGLTGATAVIGRRGIPFRSTVATFDLVKRLTSGFIGSVLVSYQAARTDVSLSGPIEIASLADVVDNFGYVHPDNPIALMCDMVIRSGLTAAGRSFYAIAVDDNTLSSYETALDTLTSFDVYYLVPATQEIAILDVIQAHIDAQSQPLQKHERIGFFSTGLTTYKQVVPAIVGSSWPTDGLATALTPTVFSSASIDWSLVSPGDMIKVLASAAPGAAVLESHRIKTVSVAGHSATTLDAFSSAVQGTAQYFRIDSFPFTKSQQAQDWRDYSASLADFRIFMMRPEKVSITYTDKTGPSQVDKQVIVPTYYLAAAFAGLCSSLPPQQPMTNVPLAGIDQLFHSNTYFNPDQLNTIAEGGNCIFVQTTANSAPHAREAISTDMTSIITKTLSITKDVDFVAKYFRNSMRPYIGNKNITAELLTQLRGIAEMVIRGLVASESMLPGTELVSLSQNADQPDAIDAVVALKVPFPCNKIYVTLLI